MAVITASKSTKVLMLGAAAGLALGAMGQMRWLPIDPVLSALSGGAAPISFGFFAPVDFDSFSQPEIMRAVYDGDYEALDSNSLATLAYLMGINDEISNTNVLMYVQDQSIMEVLDPSLSTALARKWATNPGAQEQMMENSFAALGNLFGAIAESRRSGASMGQEMATINGVIMGGAGGTTITQLQQQGSADGRRLARMYETNPGAFERIYSNMQEYAYR